MSEAVDGVKMSLLGELPSEIQKTIRARLMGLQAADSPLNRFLIIYTLRHLPLCLG